MKYFTIILIILSLVTQGFGQSQIIDERDSIAMLYIVKAEKAVEKGKIKKAKKLYRQAFETSSSNIFIQQKAMKFYVSQNDFKSAAKCISLSGLKNEQYKEKALNLYYKGIVHLHEGWEGVHNAFRNFTAANEEMKRDPYPDLNLWSDILVACGYTSLVARGQSADGEKSIFCLIHPRDLLHAYPYFYYSLEYNPENEVAQKNIDSVITKLYEAGLELPKLNGFLPPLDSLPDLIVDSLKLATLNVTDSLRSLNVNQLPKQINTLIKHLDNYDEIVMIMDISGSMMVPVSWDATLSRFDVMKELTLAITKRVKSKSNLGAITVGGGCGGWPILYESIGNSNRFDLIELIDNLNISGATPLNDVLSNTTNLFTSSKNKKTAILISDGMDSCGESFDLCGTAGMLNSYGIELSVFSFLLEGESFESDYAYQIYECMTELSEGKIFSLDEDGNMEERLIDEMKNNVDFTIPFLKKTSRLKAHRVMYEFDIEPLKQRLNLAG